MWYQKLLLAMFEGSLGKKLEASTHVLENTKPSRFYVENVRAFFGINTSLARLLCSMAVRQGYFNKKIGIECPNDGRIIKSFSKEAEIPDSVRCEVCELSGRDYEFSTDKLKRIEFFELIN